MPRPPRRLGLSTLAVTGGSAHGEADTPVVQPLVQSVNFMQEVGTADGLRYPRYGNAPNAEIVQRRLAMMEGAEASLILASGMGATACALLALLRPGDHLLASSWIYGGTRLLFTQEFATMGIDVTLVDPMETRAWRKRMRKETRAIFVESPVNPSCRVLDLRPISYLTKEGGLALVIDSTFASPVNFRPMEHGADVVIHSATKFLNGHHDVMGGAVLGTASYVEEVRQKMIMWGQVPDPFACWMLERGLKTLDVRVKRQNENALRIAQWCEGRKEIRKVSYPGLTSHPDHEIARGQMTGFGGMVCFDVGGDYNRAARFYDRLRVIKRAASLGGIESLVSMPVLTSQWGYSDDQLRAAGITRGMLRLSVGLEDAADVIADLDQALSE